MRSQLAFACAALVASAVAREITRPKWDKYAYDREPPAVKIARDAREETRPEWEHHAYDREPPAVKIARDAREETCPEWEHFAYDREPPAMKIARDGGEATRPEWDEYAYDREPVLEDIVARDADGASVKAWEAVHGGKAPVYDAFEEHAHFARSLPHFDEAEVDTSLEGYDHHAAAEYAKHAGHAARSMHDDEIDYSLEGYDHSLIDEAKKHDLHARSTSTHSFVPLDWKEAAWAKHLSYYSEHLTTKPTSTGAGSWARSLKESWDKIKDSFDDDFESAGDKSMHFAREAADAKPSHEHLHHDHVSHTTVHPHPTHLAARDAANVWDKFTQKIDEAEKKVTKQLDHLFTRSMPYEHHVHYEAEEQMNTKLHRPHQAREAEPATTHMKAEAWTKKQEAEKTEKASKSGGGWGFPW